MSCKPVCRVCNKKVFTESLTFADGTLIINLPDERSYNDNCKYCIIVTKPRPPETIADAPVVITIGANTTQYPLMHRDCEPVTACMIHSRTRYSVCVATSPAGGVFRLIGRPCYEPDNIPFGLTGVSPAPAVQTMKVGAK